MVKNRNKKLLVGLGLAVSLLGLAGCSGAAEQGENKAAEKGGQSQPDLKGIPDVVAEVNGTNISKKDFVAVYESQFEQSAAQSEATGQKPDQDELKKQTVEGMVNTELLIQEADDRGFKVTEDDLSSTMDGLATENGMESADEFLKALGEQGMDEAEVMSQLETQVKLDKLISDEAGDVAPTDEELRAAYDQAVAQQEQAQAGAEIAPFEEMKPQLAEQLQAQAESAAVDALLTKLEADADITIHL